MGYNELLTPAYLPNTMFLISIKVALVPVNSTSMLQTLYHELCEGQVLVYCCTGDETKTEANVLLTLHLALAAWRSVKLVHCLKKAGFGATSFNKTEDDKK
jgi:hypothetical protein